MADREQDARDCAARRRERESHPAPDPDLYVCRCDHDHPPGVTWCDLCEYPVRDDGAVIHNGGNGRSPMVAPDGRTIVGGGGAGETDGRTGTAPGGITRFGPITAGGGAAPATDPAHRHGGPDAGWYVPADHGWQRISDGEARDHEDAAHFMSDPNGRHTH